MVEGDGGGGGSSSSRRSSRCQYKNFFFTVALRILPLET